jgi:hypothetical protein
LEDEGKGRLVAEKKSLQTEPTFQIIDPFQASVNCLLVVAFAKTNSPNYPFAVSLAEGAERYGNAEIGGKHMHVAVFGRTQADTGRALALIGHITCKKYFRAICSHVNAVTLRRIAFL